jgi:hypothetical protein
LDEHFVYYDVWQRTDWRRLVTFSVFEFRFADVLKSFSNLKLLFVPMCCKKVRVGGKYKPTHIMLGFQCCIRLIVTIKE